MIRLYEGDWHIKSKDEALIHASNYTGFNKEEFQVIAKQLYHLRLEGCRTRLSGQYAEEAGEDYGEIQDEG